MKFYLFLIFTSFCFSQSQAKMNNYWQAKLDSAKAELTQLHDSVKIVYSKDTAFIKNLSIAQAQWEKFRIAEIRLKYPKREAGYYGSIHNICLMIYSHELYKKRIQKLRFWLLGTEEYGDACKGSVREAD